MPKRYNIRWSENDLQEIKRITKNFNAKVKRLENKYQGTNVIIPEKVTARDIQNLVETRRDLQRELKSLQRFTQRGSESLVNVPNSDNNRKMTDWQKKDMMRRANRINKVRAERKDDLINTDVQRHGQSLGYKQGQIGMGSVDMNMYKPTNPFPKNMTQFESAKKMEHLRRESQLNYWNWREKLLRNNFTNALKENFGSGITDEIIEYINKLNPSQFYEIYKRHPDDFSLGYPMDADEQPLFANELAQNWLPNSKYEKWKKKYNIKD